MRSTAALILASSLWTGCSTAEPARPVPIEPGQPFSLRAGQSAPVTDSGLRIGFDGVTADSRCPKNEQCVWAGDAVARVWFQRGAGRRETRELHTAPGAAQAVRVLDLELRLLRIDPHPVTGKVAAKQDHVATLMLSAAPAAESDR